MPGTWCLEDGVFRETSGIPLTDRGFRYGMSVFESVAVRRGRLLFLDTHLSLLQQSCEAADFPCPGGLPAAFEVLSFDQDGMLRIYVTAGDGQPAGPVRAPRTYAFFEASAFPSPEDVRQGYRLRTLYLTAKKNDWGRKTGNYWPHIQALRAVREEGCDEVMVVRGPLRIVSAAMANIFFVLDGMIHTPAADCGCREGAVKSWLRNRQPVQDSPLKIDDMRRAEECFLTNSRLGVMPVMEISGQRFSSCETGRRLAAIYREKVLGS